MRSVKREMNSHFTHQKWRQEELVKNGKSELVVEVNDFSFLRSLYKLHALELDKILQ